MDKGFPEHEGKTQGALLEEPRGRERGAVA